MAEVASPDQVQKFLRGVDHPVSKKDLIGTARREGADKEVLDTLQRLPERTYERPTDVAEEIGKLR